MDYIKRLGFSVGYQVYVNTWFGYYYYQRDVQQAYIKYPGELCGRHSQIISYTGDGFTISVLPFALDNYCYVVIDEASQKSVIIDPGHAPVVNAFLSTCPSVRPVAMACTHKHWDHCAGTKELQSALGDQLPVYAPLIDGAYGADRYLADGDTIPLDSDVTSFTLTCLSTPSHTTGHCAYVLKPSGEGPISVFTGDCLFLFGMGRIFEGCPSTMLRSLQRLVALAPPPPVPGSHEGPASNDPLLWPGHEYALSNLMFVSGTANHQDNMVDQKAIEKKIKEVSNLRNNRMPSCPGLLSEQLALNPFLLIAATATAPHVKGANSLNTSPITSPPQATPLEATTQGDFCTLTEGANRLKRLYNAKMKFKSVQTTSDDNR